MNVHEIAEYTYQLNHYLKKYGFYKYAIFLCEYSSIKSLDILKICTYKSYEFIEHHDN